MMESKSNGRSGRVEIGGVAVRWKGLPPTGGVDRGLALATAVEIDGELAREWPGGVCVECPLTLAGALHDLHDAAPDLALRAAALDELDRQYDAGEGRPETVSRPGTVFGIGEAVCGGEGPEGAFFAVDGGDAGEPEYEVDP